MSSHFLHGRVLFVLLVALFVRSEKHNRLMLGWEQLHVLGYPVWAPGATAAGVEA